MFEKPIPYGGGARNAITHNLLRRAVNCSGPGFRIDRNKAGSDLGGGGHDGETTSLTSITLFIGPAKRSIDQDLMYGECR